MPKLIHFAFLLTAISAASAQTPPPTLSPIAPIAFDTSGPVLRAPTDPFKPFTVAGEHGVLVGQQDGVFESWILPVKLISHFTIEADVAGYGVPIDVNQQSAADRSPPRPHHHHLLAPRLHRPPDHVLPIQRTDRHRPRPNRPHRPLRIRLPPSHRLHLPLHTRTQVDVARTQRRHPRPRMGLSRSPRSGRCQRLLRAPHRLPQPRRRSHHPRRRARHPRSLSGAPPDSIPSNSSSTSTPSATAASSSRF